MARNFGSPNPKARILEREIERARSNPSDFSGDSRLDHQAAGELWHLSFCLSEIGQSSKAGRPIVKHHWLDGIHAINELLADVSTRSHSVAS